MPKYENEAVCESDTVSVRREKQEQEQKRKQYNNT